MINGKIGSVDYYTFNAGSFYSDGGSSFGILPKAVWSKEVVSDNKNRVELACNLLLIRDQGKYILVDTAMGNLHDEKVQNIYRPDDYKLDEYLDQIKLTRDDIDVVILTHLHHDHIGGLLAGSFKKPTLAFPKAEYYVQKSEWEIAVNPDELNKAAYRFALPLLLLSGSSQLNLLNGDHNITKHVKVDHVGGHTIGSQSVFVEDEEQTLCYAGDIIPQKFHLNLSVTSAYDVSRQQTVAAKKRILDELKKQKGLLVLNHDTGYPIRKF